MGKKGLFGGSFNPVHTGHLKAARFVRDALSLDEVVFLPANIPPHKAFDGEGVETKDRVNMLRLAVGEEKGFSVCEIELRREGPSYTADTLRALKKLEPGTLFFLILGSDMLFYFEQWKNFREIFKMCPLVALSREQADEEELFSFAKSLEERYGGEIIVLKNKIEEVSSTEIRKKVRAGEDIKLLVPDAVREYIIKNGIYLSRRDFGALKHLVRELVGERRFAHTLGTVKTAAHLAARYGCDPEKARTAALLHDVTKGLGENEQLSLCEKYGVLPDDWTLRAKRELLHAVTGAKYARFELGIAEEEILSAIRYHTTGRANMTLLEKILYLADMIEETRDFPGVGELRAAAEKNLDEAVLLALERSMAFVEQKGGVLHPDTKRAIDFLKENPFGG